MSLRYQELAKKTPDLGVSDYADHDGLGGAFARSIVLEIIFEVGEYDIFTTI